MRFGAAFLLLSAGVLVAAACSSFSSDGAGGAGDADGGADGATSDVTPPPPGDGATETGPLPCGAAPPAPELFASPGATSITNLTSTTTHVLWLADGKRLQRKGVQPGAGVETIYVATGSIVAFAATADYVVYEMAGSFGVANVPNAGAPTPMGSVGSPFATAGTGMFALGGDLIFRSNPPGFFGGVTTHAGVTAMAGNTGFLFYLAPIPDAGTSTGVFKLTNLQTGGQPISPVFSAADVHATQLAVDGTDLFLLDPDRGNVLKVPQSGGAPATLASGEPDLGRVAVKNQQVFYSTSQGIKRIATSGVGCRATLAADPAVSFTVADSHVYFVAGSDVVRVPQ
jgi:hypothetical protein